MTIGLERLDERAQHEHVGRVREVHPDAHRPIVEGGPGTIGTKFPPEAPVSSQPRRLAVSRTRVRLLGSAVRGMMPFAIADRPTFDPLSAGGLLLGVLVACVGLGALVGWAAGSTGIGIAIGSVVGIPLAILTVYRAFRGAF
jgi:hypothetical protein